MLLSQQKLPALLPMHSKHIDVDVDDDDDYDDATHTVYAGKPIETSTLEVPAATRTNEINCKRTNKSRRNKGTSHVLLHIKPGGSWETPWQHPVSTSFYKIIHCLDCRVLADTANECLLTATATFPQHNMTSGVPSGLNHKGTSSVWCEAHDLKATCSPWRSLPKIKRQRSSPCHAAISILTVARKQRVLTGKAELHPCGSCNQAKLPCDPPRPLSNCCCSDGTP